MVDEDTNTLIAYAWPGGYPVVYIDKEGNDLCPNCANTLRHDEYSPPIAGDVYWEGPVIHCEECNREIESAYGDPDAEEGAN
jgi:hypothetical protein